MSHALGGAAPQHARDRVRVGGVGGAPEALELRGERLEQQTFFVEFLQRTLAVFDGDALDERKFLLCARLAVAHAARERRRRY